MAVSQRTGLTGSFRPVGRPRVLLERAEDRAGHDEPLLGTGTAIWQTSAGLDLKNLPDRENLAILARRHLNQSSEYEAEITLIAESNLPAHFGDWLVGR